MTLLKLQGEKVVGVYLNVSPDYQIKDNEVLIESLPRIELNNNERAYIFYRNGSVEYEVKTID